MDATQNGQGEFTYDPGRGAGDLYGPRTLVRIPDVEVVRTTSTLTWYRAGGREFYVPREQVVGDELRQVGERGPLVVPDWFASDHGLVGVVVAPTSTAVIVLKADLGQPEDIRRLRGMELRHEPERQRLVLHRNGIDVAWIGTEHVARWYLE